MTGPLCAIFAVSGAAALLFETLWFHQAALVLGSSAPASSAVLAGYMTGLGLGNALAARYGDRARNPLQALALLELCIGVAGIALVVALPPLAGPLALALAPLADQPTALGASRWAVTFALLLAPTTAMGATLPLGVRVLAQARADYRGSLSRLYGWNTLGGLLGIAVAELWLLDVFGVRGSAAFAGAGNLAAAATALGLTRRAGTSPPQRPAPQVSEISRGAGSPAPWLVAAFGMGLATLALEVVGFRFLSLFVVTRASAFAWMLAVVLGAIGLGSLLGGRAVRARGGWAGPVALGAATAVAGSYALFPWLAGALPETKLDSTGGVLRIACALFALPAFASGAAFPLIGAEVRARTASAARATGALALANTAGAALGAVGAHFALLPRVGIELGLFVVAAVYTFIGLWILVAVRPLGRGWMVAAAVAGAALALFPFGSLRQHHLVRALEAYDETDTRVVRFEEGALQTVVWLETRFLERPYFRRLVTDGYSMSATDVHARRYMKLYAILPQAVHPRIEDALLISYGVGSTAKALVAAPDLRRLDVVDTSRAILAGAEIVFPDPAERPLDDPRVAVHVEDGRHFLLRTERRYDLITGEPPPPRLDGVVNLYTREYFELAREHLKDGGLFTYWLPLRELSDVATKAIVRSFCDAFPDCSLWHGMSFELMLVGTRGAVGPVAESHFTRAWEDPVALSELAALGLERPEQLGALFIAGADTLRERIAGAEPLVDDRPRRIAAPTRDVAARNAFYAGWFDPEDARARFARSELVARLWPARLRANSGPLFGLQYLLDTFGGEIRSGAWSERLDDLRAVLSRTGMRAPVLWLLGSDADLQAILRAASDEQRSRPEAQLQLAAHHFANRDYDRARLALERAEAAPELFAQAAPLRIFALCMQGRRRDAQRLANDVAARIGDGPLARDFWAWLDESFDIAPERR